MAKKTAKPVNPITASITEKKKELELKQIELSIKEHEKAILLYDAIENSRRVVDDETGGWTILGQSAKGLNQEQHLNNLDTVYDMYHSNPYARAIVRTMVKFVFGKGPKVIPILPESKKDDDKLKKDLEKAWKEFRKINKMNRREKEIGTRLFRDGEVFIRIFDDEENQNKKIRFIRSEMIKNPQNMKNVPKTLSHGIETDPDDIETVKSYYKCDSTGALIEKIDAEEVIHLKIFCDSDEKRGTSIYRVAARRLKQYEGWLDDRIVLNKVRTAIALVRKIEGNAQNIASIRDANMSTRLSADKQKQAAFQPGTVITASKGIEYEMLSPQINAQDVKDDGRAMLLSIAAGIGFPEMIFTADFCHDLKTEVLTDHGFMHPNKALNYGFKLGTVNEQTGKLEYQMPTDWNFFNYKGIMYLFEGRRLNFMVTRNHHMWTRPLNSHRLPNFRKDRSTEEFVKTTIEGIRRKFCAMRDFVEPTELDLKNTYITIPRYDYPAKTEHNIIDKIQNESRDFAIEDMVEFIGWFVTEGFVDDKSGGFNICQSYVNADNVAEIDELLNRMPLSFTRVEEENLGMSTDTTCYWKFCDMAVAGWLRINCGCKSRDKHLPDFVWELPLYLKDLLLRTMLKGDGSDNSDDSGRTWKRLYSNSKRLISDFQRLAFELGYHATCNIKQKKEGFGESVDYADVSFGHNCMVNTRNIKHVNYNGPVWCATVPNGLLVTRREGRILISGNSNANYASSLVAMNPFIREMEDWQDFISDLYIDLFKLCIATKIEAGEIKGIEEDDVECEVEWPPLIQADMDKLAKAFETLYKYRVISRRTWRLKTGLDDTTEKLNIKEEDGEDAGYGITPGGIPFGGQPQFGQPGSNNQNNPAKPKAAGGNKFNMPMSPVNQYGAQLIEAVRVNDWKKAEEIADLIEQFDKEQEEQD